PLRMQRLRDRERVLEIDGTDLSMSEEEAADLLLAAQVALGPEELGELHRRTEGWPAALYLAALCLRQGSSLVDGLQSFGGDHRYVSDYLDTEFLAGTSAAQRTFLTRTAVLERMSGPLCESVLDLPGSESVLSTLARSNQLVVPLDRHGQWYRYHTSS